MRIHLMFSILCGQSIFAHQRAWQIRSAISHVYLSGFHLIIASEAALMDMDRKERVTCTNIPTLNSLLLLQKFY